MGFGHYWGLLSAVRLCSSSVRVVGSAAILAVVRDAQNHGCFTSVCVSPLSAEDRGTSRTGVACGTCATGTLEDRASPGVGVLASGRPGIPIGHEA
ncbi:hypothetical protein OH77DRAFT_1422974, partial [Trametes cingulata]